MGTEALRKALDGGVPQVAAALAKHPDWSWTAEVLHVDVKDGRAIAFNQHRTVETDPAAREDIVNLEQEVVLLAKINGAWKITSSIQGINAAQRIRKWGPE